MANPRVEAPHGDVRPQLQHPLHLRGAAQQRQQRAWLAEGRGHLVHDPARGADDAVLPQLAPQRGRAPAHVRACDSSGGKEARHLDGGGGGDALALRHGRRQQQPQPRCREVRFPALHAQRVHRAQRVGGPGAGQRGSRGFVRRRRAHSVHQLSRRQREGRAAVAVRAQRHDAQEAVAGAGLRGREARLSERHLQHQAAGVVRDAAH